MGECAHSPDDWIFRPVAPKDGHLVRVLRLKLCVECVAECSQSQNRRMIRLFQSRHPTHRMLVDVPIALDLVRERQPARQARDARQVSRVRKS